MGRLDGFGGDRQVDPEGAVGLFCLGLFLGEALSRLGFGLLIEQAMVFCCRREEVLDRGGHGFPFGVAHYLV